ncbi:MAG: class I SAM-dependent methyltransferase [Myxococcales bacterium]|nr:class I SAM-dependent methyltransferase [Myxococcales bacterium]
MTRPAVRDGYVAFGVEGYYARHRTDYQNPHEPQVHGAIALAVEAFALPIEPALDLACGSGEATRALEALGATRIEGVDPFTGPAYAARTGRPAEAHDFAAIAAGALAGRRYGLIVCSFALHLCPPSRLPGLTWALSRLAPRLLVLSPHKRPEVGVGWRPLGELVHARVRARAYAAEGG